jgi:hypothetical protein
MSAGNASLLNVVLSDHLLPWDPPEGEPSGQDHTDGRLPHWLASARNGDAGKRRD